MYKITAITPLGDISPRIDKFDGLQISECPNWAFASLSAYLGQEKKMKTQARKTLGFTLPDTGDCAGKHPFTAFWIGQNQWMIEAPHDTHESLASILKTSIGNTAAITEQTDGWARFDLEGKLCHDILERLCNVNTRKMTTNSVTRTTIEHLGCFLLCRSANIHFSVICPRSSANSLHHALIIAVKSIL